MRTNRRNRGHEMTPLFVLIECQLLLEATQMTSADFTKLNKSHKGNRAAIESFKKGVGHHKALSKSSRKSHEFNIQTLSVIS